MIQLEFMGEFNKELLMEELFKAFPNWATIGPMGLQTDVVMQWKNDRVYIKVPQNDTTKVTQIVGNHDPAGESFNEAAARMRVANIASLRLKLGLLGLTVAEIDVLIGD